MKVNLLFIKKDLEEGIDSVYVTTKKIWNSDRARYDKNEITFELIDEEVYGYTVFKNNERVKEYLTRREAINYILDWLVTNQKNLESARTISMRQLIGAE